MIRGTKRVQGRRAGWGMGWGSLEGEDLGSWLQDQQYFQCLSVSVGSWQQDERRRKARVLGGKSGYSQVSVRDPAAAESSCLGEVREETRGEAWGSQRVFHVPCALGGHRGSSVSHVLRRDRRGSSVSHMLRGITEGPPCATCSAGIAEGPPCPMCSRGSQRILHVPRALWGSQRVPPCPMCSAGIAEGPPCPTCST